jgi:hypothetical protein
MKSPISTTRVNQKKWKAATGANRWRTMKPTTDDEIEDHEADLQGGPVGVSAHGVSAGWAWGGG